MCQDQKIIPLLIRINLPVTVDEREKRIIKSMVTEKENIQGRGVEVSQLKGGIGIVIKIGRGIEINVKEGIGIVMSEETGISIAVKTGININEIEIKIKDMTKKSTQIEKMIKRDMTRRKMIRKERSKNIMVN